MSEEEEDEEGGSDDRGEEDDALVNMSKQTDMMGDWEQNVRLMTAGVLVGFVHSGKPGAEADTADQREERATLLEDTVRWGTAAVSVSMIGLIDFQPHEVNISVLLPLPELTRRWTMRCWASRWRVR